MNARLYRTVRVLAGQWAGDPDPVPYSLAGGASSVPGTTPVVYVVGGMTDGVEYVGSSMNGAASRLAHHLRSPWKARRWRAVWLIHLKPDTPRREVLRVEGRVGQRLKPSGSARLPKPFGP